MSQSLTTQFFAFFILNRWEEVIFDIDWQMEQTGRRFTIGKVQDCGHHLSSAIDISNMLAKTFTAPGKRDEVFSIRTNTYKVSALIPATGYKFILLADPNWTAARGRQVLEYVYGGPFVEFVAKDPAFVHRSGQPVIDSPAFLKAMRELPTKVALR
jgi:hypothetical protein